MTDPFGSMMAALRALESRWIPPTLTPSEYFDYIALPENEFFTSMTDVTRFLIDRDRCFAAPSFIDVGCGIGTKMLLARHLGYTVSGLEISPEYGKVARELVPNAEIIVADAFSFTDYDQYDVVYSYHPCRTQELQHKFNLHLASHMKPGSLLVLAGTRLPEEYNCVGDQVWLI